MALALLLGARALFPGDVSAQGPNQFRVCVDPNNLPYSNEKLEGFENKIAELIANELGARSTFTWWPDRRGFIRNTLRANLCDVVMGVPNGYDQVRWTRPTIDYTTEYPGEIVDHVASGKIDVAVIWGPLAGYFAKRQSVPLEVRPVSEIPGLEVPFTYEISMGVRKGDRERQVQLDEILVRNESEIRKILEDYGVPLVAGPLMRKPDEVKRGVVGERYE